MSSLPLPPRNLKHLTLSSVQVLPTKLYRVSRFKAGEPHFGGTGANRFDDSNRVKSRRFGTCYLGMSLEVAMAETILHDEMPVDGAFAIAAQELEHRYCVRFNGHESLRLANLTGAPLKALIGSSSISTELAYDTSKRWSSAIHAHPQMVDGLMYMSRHVNSERAVVIFDRARSKLGTARYTPLGNTTGALKAVLNLRIATRFL